MFGGCSASPTRGALEIRRRPLRGRRGRRRVKRRREPACKPNSVRRGGCRRTARGATAIYLGLPLPADSSGLPVTPATLSAGRGAPEGERDCLALHPVRFAWPPPSPGAPVGSYPTLSPITCAGGSSGHRLVCSLLHLTWRRACAAPPLGFLARAAFPDPGIHRVLTSPDFALRPGRDTAAGRTAQTLSMNYTLLT